MSCISVRWGSMATERRHENSGGVLAGQGRKTEDGTEIRQEILFPANPGSIYHMTKTQDQLLFAFYNKNDKARITDLHQGIVWGTQTPETGKDKSA